MARVSQMAPLSWKTEFLRLHSFVLAQLAMEIAGLQSNVVIVVTEGGCTAEELNSSAFGMNGKKPAAGACGPLGRLGQMFCFRLCGSRTAPSAG
jgi:hypothetical protein